MTRDWSMTAEQFEVCHAAEQEHQMDLHDPDRIAARKAMLREIVLRATANGCTRHGVCMPNEIVELAAAYMGVRGDAMRHRGKSDHKVSGARALACALMRRGKMSYPDIARSLGSLSDSAAITCVRRANTEHAASLGELCALIAQSEAQ